MVLGFVRKIRNLSPVFRNKCVGGFVGDAFPITHECSRYFFSLHNTGVCCK